MTYPTSPLPTWPGAITDASATNPPAVQEDDTDVVDLGVPTKPRRFRFDPTSPDIYTAPPAIPLSLFQEVVEARKKLGDVADKDTPVDPTPELLKMFDNLLMPESARLLRQRLDERKIGLQHVLAALNHLLEVYGLRPTQPSSPSSDSSGDDGPGKDSTSGVPNTASSLGIRLPTGS